MIPILVPQDAWAEQVKDEAVRNGCTPKWWPHYEAYVCMCDDELHAGDSQCSIITAESAKRRR